MMIDFLRPWRGDSPFIEENNRYGDYLIMEAAILGIVVPCYNEEETLKQSADILVNKLNALVDELKISEQSFLAFIDDGSIDRTWTIIKGLGRQIKKVKGLKLSNNCGHQKALLAGLMHYKESADCIITIDADLQDDVDAVESMLDHFYDGCEIVYGVRDRRDTDSWFKRITAQGYYRLMKFLGVITIYNHADFRLTSQRALKELSGFREINLYLRGIFPLIGLKSDKVYYARTKRKVGRTKYPLRKMIAFAWDSLTAFSVFPMRLILLFGLIVLFISLVLFIWAFTLAIFEKSIPGWASTVIPIYVLGGIQMAGLGLVGEYIGKTYSEVKERPRYIIEEEV